MTAAALPAPVTVRPAARPESAGALTTQEIDALAAEIADCQRARDGLEAGLREKFRVLDEQLAVIKAAHLPAIEQLQAALRAVVRSLDERRRTVEGRAGAREEAR